MKLHTYNTEETQALGKSLGELAQPGDIFLLVGQLGAGKTCLTQGIAYGLYIQDYTLSPTFVIMRELHGRLPLYHIDFYRLDNITEISELGLDDYLYGHGICVIEWAEKGADILPDDHLLIKIKWVSDTERAFEITARGDRYHKLLEKLRPAIKELTKD
ncbi:MAG: tRNA (adenosine(37)-N6)-threonylcarbamoyltransferase complex ATPase subunit type 1 TsaE [Dehalococcoidales bacterium]|nr:tRNA (adenosine(37)-N6)-threonylcarbamoyltransferase complex ATPase subunit type 1 TsaE [Dehalococcoidales bacterium]